jgi:hypothetical protein
LVARDNPTVTLEEKRRWTQSDIREKLATGEYIKTVGNNHYLYSVEVPVVIERINYESPLLICATALAAPIVLAVCLAGGKVELDVRQGRIKAHLPGITKALKELRDTFR